MIYFDIVNQIMTKVVDVIKIVFVQKKIYFDYSLFRILFSLFEFRLLEY